MPEGSQHPKAEPFLFMEWIDVNDSLPEEGRNKFSDKVLTTNQFGSMAVRRYDYEYNVFNNPSHTGEITHWMPLPEPPK